MKKYLLILISFLIFSLSFAQTVPVDTNLIRQLIEALQKLLQGGGVQPVQSSTPFSQTTAPLLPRGVQPAIPETQSITPEVLKPILPDEDREDDYIVQLNNLKITRIVENPMPDVRAVFFAVRDTGWRCMMYENEESSTALPCSIDIRRPIVQKELVIKITNDTILLLRNRQKAKLSDFQVGDKINVYGFMDKDNYGIEALIMRKITGAPILVPTTPFIKSISPSSGPVGTKIVITGTRFESHDTLVWMRRGTKKGLLWGGMISSEAGGEIQAFLSAKLCEQYTGASGLPCSSWMEVTPGTYQIYIENQNGISNTMNFTVTQFQTLPQSISAPPEYDLLKDIDKWILNYQDMNDNNFYSLNCSDGRKGNTSLNYVFTMVSKGYGEPPGDIDTPYQEVISRLQNDGWQKCKASELDDGKITSEVFIKNNRLIGVFRSYSMGVGNELTVKIQYEASPTNSVEPSIRIISPNGGEKWELGTTQVIRWASSVKIPRVTISLVSMDDPSSVRSLSFGTIPNTGVFYWSIPYCYEGNECSSNFQIPTGKYKIEISGSGVSDTSDAPFDIVAPTSQLPIRVITPNGGEVWEVGKTYTIKWESKSFVSNASIYLIYENSTDRDFYNIVSRPIYQGINTYNWTIPLDLFKTGKFIPGPYYKIVIEMKGELGRSEAPFSIVNSTTSSIYENEYMKIALLPGWTAKPATIINYYEGVISKTEPHPAGVIITKDNYIIHIDTMVEQASGIIGGRIEELAREDEAPSLYAVVTSHPGFPCGSSETYYLSNKYVRIDWYIDSQDKNPVCTPPLEGKVWYLSYITNRENYGYINYYDEGRPLGFTISMAYNSNDVNKLPKKDSAELNAMLNEMTNIVKTLEIKKPSYIKIAE